jgi:hypothetical protein
MRMLEHDSKERKISKDAHKGKLQMGGKKHTSRLLLSGPFTGGWALLGLRVICGGARGQLGLREGPPRERARAQAVHRCSQRRQGLPGGAGTSTYRVLQSHEP